MQIVSAPAGGFLRHIAVLVIAGHATLLGGCAMRSAERDTGRIQIAPNLVLVLPRPGDLGQSFEITQLVTARYGKESYVFEGHLRATPDLFLMVGLDLTGRRAITITWTDAAIAYEAAPWVPGAIRPENILADMILLYWPTAVLRRALLNPDVLVSEDATRRSISFDGQELIVADYQPTASTDRWSGRQHFSNLGWGYELEIETMELAP